MLVEREVAAFVGEPAAHTTAAPTEVALYTP
jgi:hypothetical protein